VSDHIKLHPEHWHIPLREELFGGAACVHGEDIPSRLRKPRTTTGKAAGRDRESKQLDFVQWSRRGVSRSKDCPSQHYPNTVVHGPPEVDYSVPVYCRSKPEEEPSATRKAKSKKRTRRPPTSPVPLSEEGNIL
jgi:hypothetical protein